MLDKHHPIWGANDLTATERYTALVVALLANDMGWCWGGVRALTQMSKLSDKSVRRALHRLTDTGWLKRMEDPQDKRRTAYYLNTIPVTLTAISETIAVTETANSELPVTETAISVQIPVTETANLEIPVTETAKYRSQRPLSIPPTSTLKDKDIKNSNSNSNSNSDSGHQLTRVPPPSEVKPPPVTNRPRAKPPSKRRSTKNPAYPITMDWMPEEDTVQALIQLHGIPEEFLAAELFDFVKFWVQRGDSRPGWDATFLARMKNQWQWRQQHETKQRITDAGGRPISEYDKLWNDTFEEAWGDTGGYEIDTVIVRSNPDTTAD